MKIYSYNHMDLVNLESNLNHLKFEIMHFAVAFVFLFEVELTNLLWLMIKTFVKQKLSLCFRVLNFLRTAVRRYVRVDYFRECISPTNEHKLCRQWNCEWRWGNLSKSFHNWMQWKKKALFYIIFSYSSSLILWMNYSRLKVY